jgi:hypothetical protein
VLLRVSQSDRENILQYTTDLQSVALTASISARATFPTIIFNDIRSDGSWNVPPSQLWRQFNLSELNHDLGLSLNDKEYKINASSSPDLSKLKKYDFCFTPSVLNMQTSKLQTVYLNVKNYGYLPSKFRLHLPNEKSIEPEVLCIT